MALWYVGAFVCKKQLLDAASTGVERLSCLVIMDITAIGCWIFSAGKNSDKLFCSSKGINIVYLTIIFNLWLFNDFWL